MYKLKCKGWCNLAYPTGAREAILQTTGYPGFLVSLLLFVATEALPALPGLTPALLGQHWFPLEPGLLKKKPTARPHSWTTVELDMFLFIIYTFRYSMTICRSTSPCTWCALGLSLGKAVQAAISEALLVLVPHGSLLSHLQGLTGSLLRIPATPCTAWTLIPPLPVTVGSCISVQKESQGVSFVIE